MRPRTSGEWTPARIARLAAVCVVTLVAGTIIVGIAVLIAFRGLLRIDLNYGVAYTVGFVTSAAYVGWLAARSVRDRR